MFAFARGFLIAGSAILGRVGGVGGDIGLEVGHPLRPVLMTLPYCPGE